MVELPRPENWARPPFGGWFMTVFLAFVALQCLIGTAVSVVEANWATAAGAAGAALVAGTLAWHVLPRRHRPVGPPVRVDIARAASWGLRFPVRTISPAVAVAFLVAGLAIELTPSHLVLRLSRHPVVLEWDRVRRISAAARRQGLMSLRWAGSIPTVLATRLVNDPVLVYWALRFYLQHPECRHELAGGTALHRLRAGEVLA